MRVAHSTSAVRVFRSRRAAMPPTPRAPESAATCPPVDPRRRRLPTLDAIHALIAHACRRTAICCRVAREEIAAHIARFVVAVQGRGWSAARTWRRSAARCRSPLAGRERRDPLGSGIGRRLLDELRRGRQRQASRRCARLRIRPAISSTSGSRSCRTPGCRRRSSADCRALRAVPALRTVRGGASARAAHTDVRPADCASMADVVHRARLRYQRPLDGGVTAPTGFRSAALHCGIKARPARSIWRCSPPTAGLGGRHLHDQSRAGRAGPGLETASRARARASRARSSSTAAAPTPAPATTGMDDARRMAARRRARARLPAGAGAGRIDRRDRRRPRWTRSRRDPRGASPRLARGRAATRRAPS